MHWACKYVVVDYHEGRMLILCHEAETYAKQVWLVRTLSSRGSLPLVLCNYVRTKSIFMGAIYLLIWI